MAIHLHINGARHSPVEKTMSVEESCRVAKEGFTIDSDTKAVLVILNLLSKTLLSGLPSASIGHQRPPRLTLQLPTNYFPASYSVQAPDYPLLPRACSPWPTSAIQCILSPRPTLHGRPPVALHRPPGLLPSIRPTLQLPPVPTLQATTSSPSCPRPCYTLPPPHQGHRARECQSSQTSLTRGPAFPV